MTSEIQHNLTDDDIRLLVSRLEEKTSKILASHEFCKFTEREISAIQDFTEWWKKHGSELQSFMEFRNSTSKTLWGIFWSFCAAFLLYVSYLIVAHFEFLLPGRK